MEWEPQHPIAPSGSSSLSSQSVGSSGTRSEKVPTLKQISPSPAVSALSKLTDDELRRKGIEDLVRILRRVETDYKFLLGEHGNMVKDVNRRLQIFMLETRSLKEFNQKLQDDNQELRDLCCFLDDDRQRGRKLAREWQRFGRYTASVMRSEVALYQEKLRELEDKQNELINENMELKELCLFLDQERGRMTGDRDEGDGSSNGTVTGHEDGIVPMETVPAANSNLPGPVSNNYPISPSSTASYIRDLERKVQLLEQEKKSLAQRSDRNSADGLDVASPSFDNNFVGGGQAVDAENGQFVHGSKPGTTSERQSSLSNRPESVKHAMQVLQVHEELEKTPTEDDSLGDPEKAIVREMCNVVWRTLGDAGEIGSFNESSDSIQEPPFITDSPSKPNVPPSLEQPYIQGHPFDYSSTQPPLSSTPISAADKHPFMGNQYALDAAEKYSGPSTYQMQPQRQYASRPSQEVNEQPPNQFFYNQGQGEPGMRISQNAMSERLAADKGRNASNTQFAGRLDVKRNLEQKLSSHNMPDSVSGSKPNLQQLPPHVPYQQPPPSSSHQQQHSLPDVGHNFQPLQKPIDPRSMHPQSHFQQPQSVHQQQRSVSDINTHNQLQRPADLPSRTVDQREYYHQRPSPPHHHSSSALPVNQNQRSADTQSNKLLNEQIYSQHGDLTSTDGFGNSFQQQRNVAYPPQQIKLLDAPGRHVQKPSATQGHMHNRDLVRDETNVHGQTKLQNRRENVYEERTSTERDTQPHHAIRSVSSAVTKPQNSQMSATQNLQGSKPTQNIKGPSVFRAYPPQLTSMPTQSVSLRGLQGQDLPSSSKSIQQDGTVGNYSSGIQPQNKGSLTNKRFQEQEWRQTFLDDSDTL